MSKELIEKLRLMAFESVDNDEATMLHEAADALEAKAAPLGEREAYEAWKLTMKPYGFDGFDAYQAGAAYQRAQQPQSEYGDAYQGAREDLAIWKRRALEAESRVREQDQIIENLGNALNAENGPAFMGEPVIQQPQSAEAVNRAHVMDALLMWNRRHEVPPIKIGYEYGVAGAVLDLVATPQPSAGVVMPERKSKPYGKLYMPDKYEGWNACLDEFARLNGKEVGHG